MEDIYHLQAVAAIEAEDRTAREHRISDRASQLREAAERTRVHNALCEEHGLDPEATTPAVLAQAHRAHRHLVATYMAHLAPGAARSIAFQRKLALDTGCPEALDGSGIKTDVLIDHLHKIKHRYWRIRRTPDGNGFTVPEA
jgi:hypothetical protein